MKKKVLILGGAGFIGLGISEFLGKNRNYEITIADILSPGQKDSDFDRVVSDHSIRVIKGDFAKYEMFSQLDNKYDYVYMLASVVGVNRCIEEPHEVIRINTALIQNTLNWIINNKIGKVLFSSSSECYAATTDTFEYPVPTPEEVPLTISKIAHPRFTYAVTKMLGESSFLTYGKKYNFLVTVVRYQNIFGPRMGFKHVIPHLVERFHKGMEKPFKVYGAEQTRAFCFITDASEGTVLAMENENSDQEIYHMGSPDEITIQELVENIGELMEYDSEYFPAPTYPGSVSRRCPDITKSKEKLGYSPKVNWKEGLKETVTWYKSFFESGNNIYDGGFKSPENLTYK
jgi:nucleoside-diphosphate-sugar epimerase